MSRNDERPSKEMYEQQTAMLHFPIRQELVGKRFIVTTEEATRRRGKNQSLESYSWKQGYIRACSVKDIHDTELQVLVEFDGVSWEYRQWIKIYEQTKAFFVEKTIVWAARAYHNDKAHQSTISWPALIFFPVVNYLGTDKGSKHPVEYFGDKKLDFLKENEIAIYKDGEDNLKHVFHLNPIAQEDLSGWQRLQKTQACLMNGAETLTGARVTVYRLQLRQWYTGCITAHNLITRELHVMDDNVLQTHPVHPALVQINLMANDEELHRILHGEQIKMLPRRQRTPQIYYQANCQGQKSQGGSWHIVTEMNTTQAKPGWNRPSVVRAVSQHDKPVFVPSVRQTVDSNQGTSSPSLPKQKDHYGTTSNQSNVHQTDKTNGSHCTSTNKVKVHKPIPVVLKPSDNIPFPHFTGVSQPPRPSNSPLQSSLSSTPSPIRNQLSSSPISGQHSPSPQSLRNQTMLSPTQNCRSEVSFNRSPSDQAHGVAEKQLGRANNIDSHRLACISHSTPSTMTSPRTSSVIETPEKNIANPRLVSSPVGSSPSTRFPTNNKNTEGGKHTSFFPGSETPITSSPQVTPRTLINESPGSELHVPNLSPESKTPPKVSTQSNPVSSQSQNIVAGLKTCRKRTSSKASSCGKVSHQTVVIGDGPSQLVSSSTQQRSMNNVQNTAERGHSSRTEKESTQSMHTLPVSTQSESTQSSSTQNSSTRPCNTQACSHLRTIAKIQLEYLIFLEALVRSQQKMILEAIHTINQNLTEEQFIFVADFFCKLVEGNRLTENIFREASFARQDRQRVEHQRHLSQENSSSPSRIIGCLPEEVKTRLRSAQEAVARERDEVLSVVLPLEELQNKAPHRDWEILKQQLQKQQKQQDALHHEEIQKQRQGQTEAQKQSHLQMQHGLPQDKEGYQRLSGQQGDSVASLSSENLNQLEMSNEMRKRERQRKQSQVQQESPQQNRIQVISNSAPVSAIQSPPRVGRTLTQQQAITSELLRTAHLKQLQPLLLQREQQHYEEQQQHLTVNKMVDELFQMKDIEQKTILLQHIAQTLQSQKASSKDVLKSPPTLDSNIGAGATESQNVLNKQNQYTGPHEASQTQPEQNATKTKAPCLSADQLLSSLTTSPASVSTVWKFTENLRNVPGLLSEKQPTARQSQFSDSFELAKSKSSLVVGKDKSASGSSSILLDDTSSEDTLNTARSSMDDTVSTVTSMDQSTSKKRKTSPTARGVADSETSSKPKRQRKSSKKKDSVTSTPDIAGQNITVAQTPPGSKKDHQGKSAVKSAPPGEAMSLAMATGDRAVNPVKANEEDFKSNLSRYQPRSIIKGIGFVPLNAPSVPDANSFSSITKGSHSLDVLASVSASLRKSNSVQTTKEVARPAIEHVIQSDAGRNRLVANSNRQFVCGNLTPTRQVMEKNREPTDSPNRNTDAARLGSDGTRISAERNQAAKISVGADNFALPDESPLFSQGKQSITECNRSAIDGCSEGNQNTNNLPSESSVANTDLVNACSGLVVQENTEHVAVQPKDEVVTKPSHIVKKNVDNNSFVLNNATSKLKKTKKEKQKKEKKTHGLDSKDSPQRTPRKKEHVSQPVINTARNMNLLFLIAGDQTVGGNKSNVGLPVPEKQPSSRNGGNKTKQKSRHVNALSVFESKTFDSVDIEMKETVESSKLLNSKPIESSVKSRNVPDERTGMKEMQNTSKPMDPTCATISQDGEPIYLDSLQALPPHKLSGDTVASKEKQNNKELVGSKKRTKKENKSKLDENKPKKSSEKKPKVPRNKKQEKESTAKTEKKSSKVKGSVGEVLAKETGNNQPKKELTNDPLSQSSIQGDVDNISAVSASEISSRINNGKETTRLDLTTFSTFSDSKMKLTSIEHAVASPLKCMKSEDEMVDIVLPQRMKAANVSQDSLSSKLDSSQQPTDEEKNTIVIENDTEISAKTDIVETPTKHKAQDDTISIKSASEKSKKKLAKDEKNTKTHKKSCKKLEKNNVRENISVTATLEQNKGEIATMAIEELERPEVHQSKKESLVQPEQRQATDTSVPEIAYIAENGVEKRQESFEKDIVFVNDQSVENFVKDLASKEEDESILEENLLSRKRKRSDSVVPENNDIDTPSSESNQVSSKKNTAKKSSDNGEKKEAKIRKKKVKKENVEERTDIKNEYAVSMETDTPALDESLKQDEKKESEAEAKKKVRKPKEKKARERAPKEEWVYFLQRGSCKALSSMPQCRECRNYETEDEAVLNKSCCRFDMFRRCRSKSNKLEMAGFSSSENAQGDDFLPWVAGKEICKLLSLEVSKYILLNVGDEFCNLVKKEEKAFSWETKKDTIAWKRAVRGIREMCDACATTIFNVHWVCPKCGFGVCLDCYKTKMDMSVNPAEAGRAKRFLWVRCSSNTSHRPQRLVLTHIIPKKTLNEISEELHAARDFWKIGEHCPCKRKGKELNDRATILELPEEGFVDAMSSLQESGQGEVEPANSLDQSSEIPMEIEDGKVKKHFEDLEINGDRNKKLVENEVNNATENVVVDKQSENITDMQAECKASETTVCTAEKQPEVGKTSASESVTVNQECQDSKSREAVKAPECKASTPPECKASTPPASKNDSTICEADKPPVDEIDNLLKCQADKQSNPKVRVENLKSSDVGIIGDSIGALSLLMDYESPMSSPVASPVKEFRMEYEDTYEITSLQEALLSRPHATVGESSAMTSTASEAVEESATSTVISAKETNESLEMTCESSATTDKSSVNNVSTTDGDDGCLTVTSKSSITEASSEPNLSHETEDISTRAQPKITDELPAPHSWICRRPMLRLHTAHHEGNLKAFQSRWEKGEPVLVSGVHKHMTSHLWTPEGFENEFGCEKADVVNCKTGGTLERFEIGAFWRGFESVKDRPLDNKGEPTLLKLKDWPPEADFVEKMPKRFNDLMNALPLPEYTSREGSRNLVARLPDFFVKPDLGPKMYNAYGNAAFPSAGTTNLHIDMSDAVNVMVYVGVPYDDEEYGEQERKDSLVCINVACDEVQQHRARESSEKLGALWHIFAAEDANKIRALFHKVATEKNMKYPASHDPIHDQCFYLDEPLLKRLKDEYGVVGWPIAQYLGDAIFIPAGAPHQVRNLHSCVKAAEDFVSPEHVGHCFKLTEEFRHLSEKHTNHEDKLQVKNIIYHAVKDAVSVLRQRESEMTSQCGKTDNENDENV